MKGILKKMIGTLTSVLPLRSDISSISLLYKPGCYSQMAHSLIHLEIVKLYQFQPKPLHRNRFRWALISTDVNMIQKIIEMTSIGCNWWSHTTYTRETLESLGTSVSVVNAITDLNIGALTSNIVRQFPLVITNINLLTNLY